ncbi:MAG: 4Fe-4S binding protein [Lentisphaerae bacterium]|jgi:iron only hydrogenase large subunit-like protein|nr:4Fe-4S binding protein [Lentisphaerota bacterium]
MNLKYPIYTADAECQDCFKCVRHCPVKAIKVVSGHASVIPELCVACGKCVEVCPVEAKKIRNDLSVVLDLLQGPDPVYVSLAPSWGSEFKGLPAPKLIAALRKLGFAGVSETALGAQIVSDNLAEELRGMKKGLMISSACPVVVDFVRKYLPEFVPSITPVLSPALSHALMLRKVFGENIKVVFIGPCIAKKNEADRRPDLISSAILFPMLRQWLKELKIDPWQLQPTEEDRFVPEDSKDGAIYPIEGGMNETLRVQPGCDHINYTVVSGIEALRQALQGLHPDDIREPVFLEALSCIGGCVHGPGTEHCSPGLLERLRIIRNTDFQRDRKPRSVAEITEKYDTAPVQDSEVSIRDIKQALLLIGKATQEDELNCGGCGYDTCQNFAKALLAGKAEPSMCVSYLRNLAQKKSNAILRCIPAAVVIVNKNLQLIECNRRFAELCGESALEIYEISPGMPNAYLETLIPFADLFKEVINTGKELSRGALKLDKKLLNIIIFNIEPGQVVGAILFDVTQTEFTREQIADQARKVIEKNLATVQDIACKLGEHMAETEILLRSIAENYAEK